MRVHSTYYPFVWIEQKNRWFKKYLYTVMYLSAAVNGVKHDEEGIRETRHISIHIIYRVLHTHTPAPAHAHKKTRDYFLFTAISKMITINNKNETIHTSLHTIFCLANRSTFSIIRRFQTTEQTTTTNWYQIRIWGKWRARKDWKKIYRAKDPSWHWRVRTDGVSTTYVSTIAQTCLRTPYNAGSEHKNLHNLYTC